MLAFVLIPANHSRAVVANMLVRHCAPPSSEWIWRCCRHFGRAHGVDVTRRLTPPSTWTVQREKWRENSYFSFLHLFFKFEYTGLLCEIPSFCDTYQCFRNIQCCTGLCSKKAKSQFWMTLSLKVQCVILAPPHSKNVHLHYNKSSLVFLPVKLFQFLYRRRIYINHGSYSQLAAIFHQYILKAGGNNPGAWQPV